MKFEPYRPVFTGLTLALLGLGFYLTYRRPRPAPSVVGGMSPACDCPAPRASRAGRVLIWVAAAMVAAALSFPHLAPFIFE